MEKLTLLENRVLTLINENAHLREEYRQASENVLRQNAEIQNLKDENTLLEETLAEEQQIKNDILQRIDSLLGHLGGVENV